jgi:uncharacterized membrane protein YccF (DUF307 family)
MEKEYEMKTELRPVQQTPFILRALWFIIVGWELTAIWILVAWVLNLTVVGLPLGVWMLNRVPQVLTLKAMRGAFIADDLSGQTTYQSQKQVFFLLRLLYFVVIGWWFSLLWAIVGYLLCLSLIGLPFGLVMLNNLPFVTSLHR